MILPFSFVKTVRRAPASGMRPEIVRGETMKKILGIFPLHRRDAKSVLRDDRPCTLCMRRISDLEREDRQFTCVLPVVSP